jgi:hypothetical protein
MTIFRKRLRLVMRLGRWPRLPKGVLWATAPQFDGHLIAGFNDPLHFILLRLKDFPALFIRSAEIGEATDTAPRHNPFGELMEDHIAGEEIGYGFRSTHSGHRVQI